MAMPDDAGYYRAMSDAALQDSKMQHQERKVWALYGDASWSADYENRQIHAIITEQQRRRISHIDR